MCRQLWILVLVALCGLISVINCDRAPFLDDEDLVVRSDSDDSWPPSRALYAPHHRPRHGSSYSGVNPMTTPEPESSNDQLLNHGQSSESSRQGENEEHHVGNRLEDNHSSEEDTHHRDSAVEKPSTDGEAGNKGGNEVKGQSEDEKDELNFVESDELLQDDTDWDKIRSSNQGDEYGIGAGIADITGPAGDIHTIGFGTSGPETGGIHTRLYSRAFVFADKAGNRLAYVTADLAMIDTAMKQEVLKALRDKYEDMYHEGNVMVTPTHTHSGPGGYLQYALYIMNSFGFIKQNFDVIVSGIARVSIHQLMISDLLFNSML